MGFRHRRIDQPEDLRNLPGSRRKLRRYREQLHKRFERGDPRAARGAGARLGSREHQVHLPYRLRRPQHGRKSSQELAPQRRDESSPSRHRLHRSAVGPRVGSVHAGGRDPAGPRRPGAVGQGARGRGVEHPGLGGIAVRRHRRAARMEFVLHDAGGVCAHGAHCRTRSSADGAGTGDRGLRMESARARHPRPTHVRGGLREVTCARAAHPHGHAGRRRRTRCLTRAGRTRMGTQARLMLSIGARTVDQINDNLAALDVELDDSHLSRLDDASSIRLGYPHEFLHDRRAMFTPDALRA